MYICTATPAHKNISCIFCLFVLIQLILLRQHLCIFFCLIITFVYISVYFFHSFCPNNFFFFKIAQLIFIYNISFFLVSVWKMLSRVLWVFSSSKRIDYYNNVFFFSIIDRPFMYRFSFFNKNLLDKFCVSERMYMFYCITH